MKEISKLIDKYDFNKIKDKKLLINIIERLYNKLWLSEQKELFELLDFNLENYSWFDERILYNPMELIDAIIENDILWEKIDDDEITKIILKLSYFEGFFDWKIDKLNYLEEKYNIKIKLVKDDIYSINSSIYSKWLTNLEYISAIKKIYNLLNIYPIDFIKNIKLKSIIVVSYFYKKDSYDRIINLWWFETLSDDNIYISYRSIISSFDHEIYHQAMQYYDDFDKWLKIREKQDISYTYKEINKKSKWFARNYWKENISEDQATIAEELFLNYDNLLKRSKNDKILEKKIFLVKKAYFKLSNWKMNDSFFENIN